MWFLFITEEEELDKRNSFQTEKESNLSVEPLIDTLMDVAAPNVSQHLQLSENIETFKGKICTIYFQFCNEP